MSTLPTYKSIADKNRYFRVSAVHKRNIINDVKKFEKWYRTFSKKNDIEKPKKPTYFFRGVPEAKFKLFNSAQRVWITTEIETWKDNPNYLEFLKNLLTKAKDDNLIKSVIEFYRKRASSMDFPLLSLLQHYGGPTPLIDCTYNLDIALYFSSGNITSENSHEEIDNYFSIYIINNSVTRIRSISLDIDDNKLPSLNTIFERIEEEKTDVQKLFYLSDYENTARVPLTTIYNQNIIPQKGSFIFNPSPTKPLEDYFHLANAGAESNRPFMCYNIHKNLAEYIRRKMSNHGINKNLLFPDLKYTVNEIKEKTLNSYFSENKIEEN